MQMWFFIIVVLRACARVRVPRVRVRAYVRVQVLIAVCVHECIVLACACLCACAHMCCMRMRVWVFMCACAHVCGTECVNACLEVPLCMEIAVDDTTFSLHILAQILLILLFVPFCSMPASPASSPLLQSCCFSSSPSSPAAPAVCCSRGQSHRVTLCPGSGCCSSSCCSSSCCFSEHAALQSTLRSSSSCCPKRLFVCACFCACLPCSNLLLR